MYKAFFYLALQTGARRGELVALTWEDVDLDSGLLTISKAVTKTSTFGEIIKQPKTAAGYRTITIDPESIRVLKEWRKMQIEMSLQLGSAWEGYRGKEYNKNYIFTHAATGRRISVDTVSAKFRDIILLHNEQCANPQDKLPMIRLHDLRHTNASLQISHGIDPVTVSHRLGHAKPSTTLDIYSHVVPAMDAKASDLLGNFMSINS